MRKLVLVLAAAVAASAFADRTANRKWVEDNFIGRTNEWRFAERRYALFIIDLNGDHGGKWRSFELKGSDGNFVAPVGGKGRTVFWSTSDEADQAPPWSAPEGGGRNQDGMRLFWLTTRGATGRDGRSWTRIDTTLQLSGPNPKRLAVIVAPDRCIYPEPGWLGEFAENTVWCYTRADAAGPEKDTNGQVVWHPVQPVRWYRNLPEWAR